MSSGGLAGLPLGLQWLCARDYLMEFEFHHSNLMPAQARLSTSTQLGARALLGCRTGSALHQACPGMLSLAASCPGLCHDSEPCHFSTGHQTLPRGPAGAQPGTSSSGGVDMPAACHSCSLPEDKGVNLSQRNSPYFYSCCHH